MQTIPFVQVALSPVTPLLLPLNQAAGTAIPLGVDRARCEFDVQLHTDPGTKLTIAFDLSLDGGASWIPWGSATRQGGVGHNKDGTLATTSAISVDLFRMIGDPPVRDPAFDPQNPNRRIRAQVTAVGAVTVGPGSVTLTP